MSGLPPGWIETKLELLTSDISYGYTASSTENAVGPKMLRITDIQDNNVDWDRVPYCEIEDNKIEKYLLKSGDLVFARTGATVGKSYLIKGGLPNSVYASYLIRVRCSSNDVVRYLSHFFNSPSYWQQITELSAGVGQPNVNGSKLKNLTVVLPPLNEQTRFANKLDSLLAKVDKTQTHLEKIPTLLKRFRQSVLAAATSGELTKEWRDITGVSDGSRTLLGEVGKVIAGQSPSVAEVNTDGRGEPYVTGPEQWDGKKILHHKWTEFPKRMAPDNSIFVTVKGAGVGKTFLGCYAAIGRDVYAFVPNENVDQKYVLFSIQASAEDVILKAKGLIPGLTKADLTEHEIYLPKELEQKEIVRRVESLFALADVVEKQHTEAKKRVDRLTQSILAKAFRGELVPQDPNDEPAEKLLERIRQQREQQAAAQKAKKKTAKKKVVKKKKKTIEEGEFPMVAESKAKYGT